MFPNNWISCIKKPRGTFKYWKEGPKSVTCVLHSFIKTSRNPSRLGVPSVMLPQLLLACPNLLALRSHLRGRQRRRCLQWARVRVAPTAGIRRKQEILVEVWGRMSSGCVHRRGNSLKTGAWHPNSQKGFRTQSNHLERALVLFFQIYILIGVYFVSTVMGFLKTSSSECLVYCDYIHPQTSFWASLGLGIEF